MPPSFWGVFWIDASTPERATQTLSAIAEVAGLDKNAKAALHWLSNLEHRWLLMIDNADDDDIQLEDFFPKGDRGNILVTTRNPAHKVHGNVGPRYYDFRGLELDAATRLLLKASDEPVPWTTDCEALALTITKALGFLALAIVHAGAAIRDRLCSLRDYLDYYSRSWRRIRSTSTASKSLKEEEVVYATWEICYRQLEQRGTQASIDALELLKVLAFLHWETISSDIFIRALRNPKLELAQSEIDAVNQASNDNSGHDSWIDRLQKTSTALFTLLLKARSRPILPDIFRGAGLLDDTEEAEDRIRFALKELARMSLIIRNDHNNTYSIHPLVHTWARERRRMGLAKQALWADIAGRVLAASILLPPLGTSSDDEKYHISILPHVEHVRMNQMHTEHKIADARHLSRNTSRRIVYDWVTSRVPTLAPDAEKMRMYAKFGVIYAKCGHWESAEKLLKEVVQVLRQYPTAQRSRPARGAMLFLAKIYWNMSNPEAASELQLSVLKTCQTHLAMSHPDTIGAMSELGQTRWQQGQYTEARKLQEHVLRERTRLYHPEKEHPDILDAMDHLGRTVHKFWETRDFEEAFRLLSDAVAGMFRVHGRDHERTLEAIENLCRVSVLLGGDQRVQTARKLMAEVLETRRARLGREHPYTLLAMVNMAIVLGAAGSFAEAEALIHQGLPVADRNLGPNHIGTLFGRHTLASLVAQQGRHAEAEKLLMHVADGQRLIGGRGDHHPDRLGALVELTSCCFRQGKVERAIVICDEAIAGFEAISVAPHPLNIALRTAREKMRQLLDSGAAHDGPEGKDITFPFIIFRMSHDG